MPGLTVTEKEHWKNRIGKRIDRKIDALVAGDPGLFERINREANQKALESLGIFEFKRELDEIEKQEATMERRKKRLRKEMSAKVRGVPIEDIEDGYYYAGHNSEVDTAVSKRQSLHEEELLAQNELGRQILSLRAERDCLLDSIWLATSPRQIKDLWSKVAELLGEQPTQLERDALAIPAISDE
jgi:hypothetical protein